MKDHRAFSMVFFCGTQSHTQPRDITPWIPIDKGGSYIGISKE